VATADDAAARFVGLDAYEAAGGHVVRDLFSDRGDGYVADKELLNKLFRDKLEAVADQVRAEGWSWVDVRERVYGSDLYSMDKSKPTTRPLTEEEEAKVAALVATAQLKREQAEAHEDDDSDEYDTLRSEADQADADAKAIRDAAATYSDRQKKKAGAIIGLNYSGALEIHRGLIKEEAKSKKVEPGVTVTESGKPAHPESLVRKLSAHKTMAIQASLADNHRLALDTLCHSLAVTVFYSGGYGGNSAVRINAHTQTFNLRQHADDIEQSKAWTQMDERRAGLKEALPETPAELLGWLQEQPLETVLEILAFCTASCVDGVQHQEGSRPLAELEAAAELNMGDWWQASAGSYFKHVRKEGAIAVIKQVDPAQDGEKLAKLKKGELDKHAEAVLAGSGWLPGMLSREVKKEKGGAVPNGKIAVRYRDASGNTWTGRGKRPTWLVQALADGKALEEFLVREEAVA